MKFLVIDEAYPSNDNLYADGFVHVRVKAYLARGHDVRVAAGFKGQRHADEFDGVRVDRLGKVGELAGLIDEGRADAVLVHFPTFPFIRFLATCPAIPVVAWVHGFEALGWYRRLFNINRDPIHFARYIKGNLIQLAHLRRFIQRSNAGAPIRFNFVSQWMRRATETDCLIKVQQASVIPNPVDDSLFTFAPKNDEQRQRVLVIRPFEGRKYATDIIYHALVLLKQRGEFDRFRFTMVGRGASTSPIGREFAGCVNVTLTDRFLTQPEIAALHREHGIFLCPTRQDAQGVSMCEAMASGLVPVSSNNTAIPEFVSDGISGLLTNNQPVDVAEALLRLAGDPQLFRKLSAEAARSICEKARLDSVIDREIALVRAAGTAVT